MSVLTVIITKERQLLFTMLIQSAFVSTVTFLSSHIFGCSQTILFFYGFFFGSCFIILSNLWEQQEFASLFFFFQSTGLENFCTCVYRLLCYLVWSNFLMKTFIITSFSFIINLCKLNVYFKRENSQISFCLLISVTLIFLTKFYFIISF